LDSTPAWKNTYIVDFWFPNTYPEGDERRIVYACDSRVWRDELKRLSLAAHIVRASELRPGTEAQAVAVGEYYECVGLCKWPF
jgi:hypothetical protein